MQQREFYCYDWRNQTYVSGNRAELAKKIIRGEIDDDTYLWSPHLEKWIALADADELAWVFNLRARGRERLSARAQPLEATIETTPELAPEPTSEMESGAAPEMAQAVKHIEEGPAVAATERRSLETALSRAEHILFLTACLLACSIFWMAPRPPMIDLPQHAGQITLLRDLLFNKSPFANLVTINFVTPYLIGYLLALPFSIFLPVATALQIVSTGALIAFILVGLSLRKEISDDRRFDWLILIGFFGFVFHYGVYVFYVSAPVFLYMVIVQIEHARTDSARSVVKLLLIGTCLLFSHGLLFALSFISGAMIVLNIVGYDWRSLLRRARPYIALAAEGALVYFVMRKTSSPEDNGGLSYDEGFLYRIYSTVVYLGGDTFGDTTQFYIIMIIFISAFLVGRTLHKGLGLALLGSVLAVLMLAPDTVSGIFFIRQRFAMLLGPFSALALAVPRGATQIVRAPWLSVLARLAMIAATFAFLGLQALRAHNFLNESADFEKVLSYAEPAKRALSAVFPYARLSPAMSDAALYGNWPVWYQADKGGFVEPSFAHFAPQVVRYRPGAKCWFCGEVAGDPKKIDWGRMALTSFHYVFIRGVREDAIGFFDGAPCRFTVAAQSGMWWLFRQETCTQRVI